ncbi:MAG TPA: peptidylprolyl isomerase [Candidatus Hydrogenedentes bacterium]|nr:peptidylprolyl isomerase [Candidatus Hydrogenedentota bacterium]HOS04013.1 peptidylprolyl isomerase [Candidatus Hydrogenedentota bacterium]
MNKKALMIVVLAVGLAAIAGVHQFRADRLTKGKLAEISLAEKRLSEADAAAEKAAEAAVSAAPSESVSSVPPPPPVSPPPAPPAATPASSETGEGGIPEVFKVRFDCSSGAFVVECHRDWAPRGVEQFYKLVTSGYYDGNRFFRVADNPAIVQFGLNGDPEVTAKWRFSRVMDDPVKQSNVRGTICFAATRMPNSRTTQLFINRGDNSPLDRMGFAVFGKVISGMDAVDAITDEYGERPDQGAINTQGNAYLEQHFPRLDYIKKAEIVP